MFYNRLMSNSILINKAHARRFILAHHRLLPPRQLLGKQGVLDYIQQVGCIQFDTVNVVGANADLVLQSRVAGYTPALLEELLYQDRSLIDGWDKQASIHQSSEWPFFSRRREAMRNRYGKDLQPDGKLNIAPEVKAAIGEHGPLSSIDIDHDEHVDWSWGDSTRTVRAAMEALFAIGELGIHHRVHTRRVFDLIENLLPASLLNAEDPHPDDTEYVDWHVTRRIGSLGLANPKSGEHWYGLRGTYGGVKTKERRKVLARLAARGEILQVEVEGLPREEFYIRRLDLPALEAAADAYPDQPEATLIAPLDNLMWHRDVVEMLFDFYYRWEVYVPAAKRQYGYYVLPVLYGDQLVARLDPEFDRASKCFTLKGWWWESGINPKGEAMLSALQECLSPLGSYLGATEIRLGEAINGMPELKKMVKGASSA